MDSRTHLLLFFILALLTTAVVADADEDGDVYTEEDDYYDGDADGGNDADAGGDNNTDEDMSTVIGIDLGTTYSCVAIFKQGRAEVIVNGQGHRVTPSYVAFTLDDELLVGDAAKNQMISNPENTIFDAKRLIGRSWSDKNVQHDIPFYPFKVVNKGNKPYVQVNVKGLEKTFAPEEISAMVLGKMREMAEAYLGKKVTHAVVTVPAYFNNGQRQATKDAGTIAGLNITKIINEPTAAAIAYGLNKREGKHTILVFDLGGGTFDVSILTINNGAFRVRATNGDTHLGGQDFDHRVMDHFIQLHKKKTGKDIRTDRKALQKLRREVEKAKLALSFQQQVLVEVDALIDGEDFSAQLTRAKFEELNMDLFKSLMNPVKQVLEDAEMKKEEMDEIVLVGGSTRIPKVQQLVQEFFNRTELSRGINPDEAVAEGAAVQAGILDKEEDTGGMVLVDVNPLTLGIEVNSGAMSVLIPRNTVLPTKKSSIYSTVRDNQLSITVTVYEGERSMAEDNHFLGKFDLTGILPAPRGVPQLEITFEVDFDGILHVTAVDKGTGNTNSIVIEKDQAALSQKEIERMLQDAERYADKDRKVKERVDAKNQLETYVYNIRNQVNDKNTLGGKLNKSDKESILEAVKNAIAWVDENQEGSAEEFREKQKEVETIVQPIVRKLYGRDEL